MESIKDIQKKKEFWKWVIQVSIPVITLLIMFGYTSIRGWGSNKAQDALDKQSLCYKLDSICKNGVEKDIRDNTQDIEMKDFKETMTDYAQRQEKMYLEVKNNQRTLVNAVEKVCIKVGVATDLIEELKERETAKERVINNNSNNR